MTSGSASGRWGPPARPREPRGPRTRGSDPEQASLRAPGRGGSNPRRVGAGCPLSFDRRGVALSYSDFNLQLVEAHFGVTSKLAILFPDAQPALVPGWLREQLD